MTREWLLSELKKWNINVVNTAKRDELIKELELALANETETMENGKKEFIWNIETNANYCLFLKKIFLKIKIKMLYGKYIVWIHTVYSYLLIRNLPTQ